MLENVIVRRVTYQKNVAKITLQGVKKNTDLTCQLFEDLAKENIVIDSIVQDLYSQDTVTVSFIVTEDDFIPSLKITEEIAEKIGVQEIHTDCNLAKVSIKVYFLWTGGGVYK